MSEVKLPSFSPITLKVLKLLEQSGFYVTLVGGALRDFYLSGSLGSDLDFELRSEIHLCKESWEKASLELVEKLDILSEIRVEKLKFNILRIYVKGSELEMEFAPARQDLYLDKDTEGLGHSDFEVNYLYNPDYKSSFKRRDLSINSIGLEVRGTELSLVDPYDGMSDLANKRLVNISDDFYKDPVRLLRLIRFNLEFKFNISDKIDLSKFDLRKLTHFYFFKEAKGPFFKNFTSLLIDIIKKNKVQVPIFMAELELLEKVEGDFITQENLSFKEAILMGLLDNRLLNSESDDIVNFLGLKKKWVKSKLADSLK